MLHLEPLESTAETSAGCDGYADRVIFQTAPWLRFIAQSQRAEVVRAAVRDGDSVVGQFTGLLTRRYGLRILGSPLPGWTTSYLGFNLDPGVSRRAAVQALLPFAFRDLGCAHLEIRDRGFVPADLDGLGLRWTGSATAVIDLSADEDAVFGRMTSPCRRNIRKADRSGVVIEVASDSQFADDYYRQLRDVFAKQNLVPTYSVDRVRTLIRHLAPTGNLLLLRARAPDGKCIATAILPWLHRTMYFWGGASYREHQHLRPNEALIWYALRYAKSRGVVEFDFVGGNPYKSKYGTSPVSVPWARRSRSPLVAGLRNAAKEGFAIRQRAAARVAALRDPAWSGGASDQAERGAP
jgi:CelD/BcsL family acetyltransferase involved in cellulose biosynthesis